MIIANRLLLIVAMLGAAGLPMIADASAVTYGFVDGSVTINSAADANGNVLANLPQSLALTGTQATFDTAAGLLDSFVFTDANTASFAMTGTTGSGISLTGSSFNVTGLTASFNTTNLAANDVALTQTSANSYNFTIANAVTISGKWSVSGNLAVPSTSFNNTDNSVSGTITLGPMDTVQLTGISLGTFTVDKKTTVQVQGNILFDGMAPVPLPPTVWLLGSALGVLGLFSMSRKHAY